jgi:hypothetical protein
MFAFDYLDPAIGQNPTSIRTRHGEFATNHSLEPKKFRSAVSDIGHYLIVFSK